MRQAEAQEQVRQYFRRLHRAWGEQHWWPADTAFEMIVGAFLTQNTAWTNVERALHNLRAAGVLSIDGIRCTPLDQLEELVKPAGYFRQKAARLKAFVQHLDQHHKDRDYDDPHYAPSVPEESDSSALKRFLAQPTAELREELLALKGIGPETADSILLYAGAHPVFVVDAYTRRIFERHGLVRAEADYEEIRALIETALAKERCLENHNEASGEGSFRPPVHTPSILSRAQRDTLPQVFNEFHALLVQVGKHLCLKKSPQCEQCPLREFLPATRARKTVAWSKRPL